MEKKRNIQNNTSVHGRVRYKLIENGEVVEQSPWNDNSVMNSDGYGVNINARALTGDLNILPEITAAKIGTGTTQPSESDTDLESPSFTTTFIADSKVIGTDTARLQFFITDSEISNDTYTEFGIFTPPPNDRRLYARALFNPEIDKSDGQSIRVEYDITYT